MRTCIAISGRYRNRIESQHSDSGVVICDNNNVLCSPWSIQRGTRTLTKTGCEEKINLIPSHFRNFSHPVTRTANLEGRHMVDNLIYNMVWAQLDALPAGIHKDQRQDQARNADRGNEGANRICMIIYQQLHILFCYNWFCRTLSVESMSYLCQCEKEFKYTVVCLSKKLSFKSSRQRGQCPTIASRSCSAKGDDVEIPQRCTERTS